MLKVAVNLEDLHVAQGRKSHAELLRTAREWDENVRLILFPEKRAVYVRYYAPKWDGMSQPTQEDDDMAYRAADKALDVLIRRGLVEKSWAVFYWNMGDILSPSDVRL